MPAIAQGKKLTYWGGLIFSDDANKLLTDTINDWGKKNGVAVTVDHIPHLELPARAAAEVSAGAGHDIFAYGGSGGPHLYEKHTIDLSSLVSDVEKKHGKVHQIGRQIGYNEETKVWSALPTYYISFPAFTGRTCGTRSE